MYVGVAFLSLDVLACVVHLENTCSRIDMKTHPRSLPGCPSLSLTLNFDLLTAGLSEEDTPFINPLKNFCEKRHTRQMDFLKDIYSLQVLSAAILVNGEVYTRC